ncbi:hypothetical protein [Flexivirga caeni]|uniref:hypothetical protein n=1 Tax=Flexivirga caeni TaxID=2294115 RepID=UPI0011CDF836|nr:hypothetical protein [Flexivirga caeni]
MAGYRLAGAVALRLSDVRLDAGDPPLELQVQPGTLHVLRMQPARGHRLLRVLAGLENAYAGTATTLAGVSRLSEDGHPPVLQLVALAEITRLHSPAHAVVGLTDDLDAPAGSSDDLGATSPSTDQPLHDLMFLVDVEGHTVLAAGRTTDDPSGHNPDDSCHPPSMTRGAGCGCVRH